VAFRLIFDPVEEARAQWLSRWPVDDARSMATAMSIMRVHQILLTQLNELLKPFGLTFARYEALMLLHLSRAGSLPLGKLGDRLQVHRSSVTNLIDGLERDSLVERIPHGGDRRTVLAAIRPEGRHVAELASHALNSASFATAPLAEGDLESIFSILRKLRAGAGDFDA
jgi:DNA-binding MarR family transcriptional regulator